MKQFMDKLYDNLDEAKAFSLSFTNFVYFYDDVYQPDFLTITCENCKKAIQTKDYLMPRSSCKKPTGILHTLEFGVNQELRDELIEKFDITEEDFRPIRNKRGEIVYYQITPQHVLLPLHEENGWRAKPPCPQCGSVQYESNKFRNDKKQFFQYISQEALDDMHDLNITYERFRFFTPYFVISRRLYDFLTEKYPRSHYVPFFLK
jgi:predicted nucleic-acid-binding Zn-ribbon protein